MTDEAQEQLEYLNGYLTAAEKDDRLKANDLLRCCSWFLPMEEIIDAASGKATTPELQAEVRTLGDDDVYFDDLSEEARALVVGEVDVNDDSVYVEMSRGDPSDIPSWFYMSPSGIDEGWLVHFSDYADTIVYEGFRQGVQDISRLGLTTYLEEEARSHPGFNFAYEPYAVPRFAYVRRRPKYGTDAVIFYASYLRISHHSDEEPQAIFWGPSAEHIHELSGSPGEWFVTVDDEEYEFEDLDAVEKFLDERVKKQNRSVRQLKSKLLR